MRVLWIHDRHNYQYVWIAVEIEPGFFSAQLPYLDEQDRILMQTHHISEDTIEQMRASGYWSVVKEIDTRKGIDNPKNWFNLHDWYWDVYMKRDKNEKAE